jgi:hypothetical protein
MGKNPWKNTKFEKRPFQLLQLFIARQGWPKFFEGSQAPSTYKMK